MTHTLLHTTWHSHRESVEAFARETGKRADAAHDHAHLSRVVATAARLCDEEGADPSVVLPAAWLHDCVHVPVNSPDRPRASLMAADMAVEFLRGIGYDEFLLHRIHHAIAAHSFSARIAPLTPEARVVQDADRLDAIGAIGVARCLVLGGQLGRPLYDADDPFCEQRAPSDAVSSIDHFYTKLLTLAGTMQTASGRREAERRTAFMQAYLQQLRSEI